MVSWKYKLFLSFRILNIAVFSSFLFFRLSGLFHVMAAAKTMLHLLSPEGEILSIDRGLRMP